VVPFTHWASLTLVAVAIKSIGAISTRGVGLRNVQDLVRSSFSVWYNTRPPW
jgi:hypothetical protein